ncbi:A/G-specific adenine glycosylase [Pseudodesulfovibrio sp.]|uniref:A/G-specific adenine glycosylase n=1 Tax=unclassified Pseudodesulfovibrio TaxID=2661612 RepID=UPI003AFFB940
MDGKRFTQDLLDWYDRNRRDLPWRDKPEPYAVWISEVMAQQTQMDRVVTYHDRWMQHLPTLEDLAAATEDKVLKLWEGLGYYSRARNLQKAAAKILQEHGGKFPDDPEAIRALPGVGPYTAGAIASIAFNRREPAVDANVLRVFARLLDLAEPIRTTAVRSIVEAKVRELIPEDRPGDFNQALMELGALVCSKGPDCGNCPVREHCEALAHSTVSQRPVPASSTEIIPINMATGVLVHENRVLIQKRKLGDVWPGLWEFPGGIIERGESPEQTLAREYVEEVELAVAPLEPITVVRYSYTRYRVTMHCYLCENKDGNVPAPVFHEAIEGRFVSWKELDGFAFPSGHRRLLDWMRGDARYSHLF